MSITETLSPSAGFHPLNRVRDLLHLALPASVADVGEPDLPQSPRNRYEALIHAARTAFSSSFGLARSAMGGRDGHR